MPVCLDLNISKRLKRYPARKSRAQWVSQSERFVTGGDPPMGATSHYRYPPRCATSREETRIARCRERKKHTLATRFFVRTRFSHRMTTDTALHMKVATRTGAYKRHKNEIMSPTMHIRYFRPRYRSTCTTTTTESLTVRAHDHDET